MTKVLCIGADEGEGSAEQHHSGSQSCLQTFALFNTPSSFFDPTQPLAAPFLLLDTVLYCTVPWTLCLLFSGIYHVAKCLLSLIFSQVDCSEGRVLLQNPAKLKFLQRAWHHPNLQMRKSFKANKCDDDSVDFLKTVLLNRN